MKNDKKAIPTQTLIILFIIFLIQVKSFLTKASVKADHKGAQRIVEIKEIIEKYLYATLYFLT